MFEAIYEKIKSGTPLLGICLGAQLLMDESEEDGSHKGFGWIPGKVKRFRHKLKIPQIGWNQVSQKKTIQYLEEYLMIIIFILYIHFIWNQIKMKTIWVSLITAMSSLQLLGKIMFGEYSFTQKKAKIQD